MADNIKRISVLASIFLAMLSLTGAAATTQTEKVLVPLVLPQPVPGAFGSLFTTKFSILNESGRPVLITGYDPLCVILCPPTESVLTPPGVTYVDPPLAYWVSSSDGIQGYFLHVETEVANRVRFNLRVQDLSRQAQTWGTELPVVAESDALLEKTSLVNIPVIPGFRLALRIYDFDSGLNASVLVRFCAVDLTHRTPVQETSQPEPDRLLLELPLNFRTANSGQGRLAYPGYVELLDFGSRPELSGVEAVRVEINPVGGLRYWAFVSVTNNETQHITIVSPR